VESGEIALTLLDYIANLIESLVPERRLFRKEIERVHIELRQAFVAPPGASG